MNIPGFKITKELLASMTPEKLAHLEKIGNLEIASEIREHLSNTPVQLALKKFITEHSAMNDVKKQVEILAPLDYPVLILGETGTGKEIIAQALHGDRKPESFIEVNCGGIPDQLIESELFGHVKGAFTGAANSRDGMLKLAENGTVFLDEIGDMAYSVQAKLLRALQPDKMGNRYIKPVGGNEPQRINCRIVAATHRNLEGDWRGLGKFRDDLFYRLNTFVLKLLPMRSRRDDIKLIVKHLDRDKKISNLDEFCSLIRPEKLDGNVRSIEQIVLRHNVLGLLPHE